MVQKSMMKMKRKNAGKLLASLLLGVMLIAGTAVPVSAANESTVPASSVHLDGLQSLWTELTDWLIGSIDYCMTAYYVPGTGLTFLGVLVVAILAMFVVAGLILFLYKILRFGR